MDEEGRVRGGWDFNGGWGGGAGGHGDGAFGPAAHATRPSIGRDEIGHRRTFSGDDEWWTKKAIPLKSGQVTMFAAALVALIPQVPFPLFSAIRGPGYPGPSRGNGGGGL